MHTFLFTDIAGHTELWEENPAAMSSALADCERLLETAVSASGGRVVKREGDAVMAVFEDPSAAVAAAAAAQSELAQRRWPGVGELRVRIGLHVGAAEHRDGDYYGSTVIRAARLCACAHGGQVVASSAVAALAPNVSWLDLGEYRLRGLREPERIHQLVLGDERRFPPLRDVEPTIDRLPRPRTSFVGRADEVSAGIELLSSNRIVTLTGAGGSGKTRLAVEIARASLDRFSGGAVFVDLAPLAAFAG
ncbi:MAG: adenylate/guanylate cyclase domain-containing protein, partial [Acidimicrobiia bacterium]